MRFLPALFLSASMAAALPLGQAARPNVILVMTDDQRYLELSAHGNPVLNTPFLDKLHSQSVRFTDYHASPMCTPTRGSLMTGLDPARNGAINVSSGRSLLRANLPTMADLLLTLLDLCGAQTTRKFDGISLAPALRGQGAVPAERMLVINYSRMPGSLDFPTPDSPSILRREAGAVLWKRWRMLRDSELYNLETDPLQKKMSSTSTRKWRRNCASISTNGGPPSAISLMSPNG